MSDASAPPIVWSPSADLLENSHMARLARAVGAADYDELWRWSIEDLSRFWSRVWEMFDLRADGDPTRVLTDASMPGAEWFPDVTLSFPEHAFRDRNPDDVALHAYSEGGPHETWTWGRLSDEVARVRAGLVEMGVGRGDRVVGYLPHVPETIAAFFATTSLGAVWSCCSPDFGVKTVLDRLQQIEPAVLLAVEGYRFGGRDFDRSEEVASLRAGLPTLKAFVVLDRNHEGRGGWDAAFPSTTEPVVFERVPFDHPLWIVFSSGTTGLPKAIVHGHGGVLLEQFKSWSLHHNTSEEDLVFWYTTTGWVLWNLVVGALVTGTPVVIYDGSPLSPTPGVLWDIVEEAGVTVFGAGAAYLHGCMKQGLVPRDGRDLSGLRAISSSGSPLSPDAYLWVKEAVGDDVWVASSSGGTDIAGAFVGGCPLVPVRAGELSVRMLGVSLEAWDDDGHPLIDEVGELVVTAPIPSMPVRLWNDPDDERYLDSYFSMYPGVWRHGDWIRITPEGSAVIYGRSDSTINRGGVRMGTAEIYAVVTGLPAVVDALVVDVPAADGLGASRMELFVALADGAALDDDLVATVKQRLRADCSPRHVPDVITAAPAIPRTLSGKVLEVPVKKLLMGWEPDRVASRDALADPLAFDWFVAYAQAPKK